MSAEEPGLLGNLPRSRPGTRSEKRGSATAEPARGAATGTPPSEPGHDPVTGALKGALSLAGAGLRTADGLTRHVLRRVPRP